MDFNPTADKIQQAAKELRYKADEIELLAAQLRDKKNFEIVVDAINKIQNIPHQLQVDTIVARIIREYERHVAICEENIQYK